MKNKFPSSKEIISLLLDKYKSLEINQLHQKAYKEIIRFKKIYYENKVDRFLEELDLPESIRKKLKDKMLSPVEINGKTYSNFLEETCKKNYAINSANIWKYSRVMRKNRD